LNYQLIEFRLRFSGPKHYGKLSPITKAAKDSILLRIVPHLVSYKGVYVQGDACLKQQTDFAQL